MADDSRITVNTTGVTITPNPDNAGASGDPQVVSNTEGEKITPNNPEVVQQTPVDTKNKQETAAVEDTK